MEDRGQFKTEKGENIRESKHEDVPLQMQIGAVNYRLNIPDLELWVTTNTLSKGAETLRA